MKKIKEKIFKIVGNNQKNPFRGNGTICNCLPAAMGMGGGYIPYIFLEIENGDWHNSEHNQRIEVGGNISNSITPVLKDNYVFMEEAKKIKTPRPEGKGWCWDENNGKWFRIRKLTPRECFRLMDVSEEGIDKIQTAIFPDKKSVIPIGYGVPDAELKQTRISDSQQYKMAGNSIVVACLSGIFENLFTQEEVIKETLF